MFYKPTTTFLIINQEHCFYHVIKKTVVLDEFIVMLLRPVVHFMVLLVDPFSHTALQIF